MRKCSSKMSWKNSFPPEKQLLSSEKLNQRNRVVYLVSNKVVYKVLKEEGLLVDKDEVRGQVFQMHF